MKFSLSMRIYALGLLQTLAVLFGFVVFAELARPEPPHVQHAQEYALASAVEADLDRPHAVALHLERATADGLEASVFLADGTLVASSVESTDGPCRTLERSGPPRGHPEGPGPPEGKGPPPEGKAPPHGPPPRGGAYHPVRDGAQVICYALPQEADGQMGKIEFRRAMPGTFSPLAPPIIVFTLAVVALASWLLLRSIVKPLQTLGSSAAALGRGDLGVRTGIERDDELGEVASAFDTMAGRIEDLVRGERELIANISHELRTPLARIRVAFDLANESATPEDTQLAIADIGEDLDELDQLVRDVLDDARAQNRAPGQPGTPRLHLEELDMMDCLDASMDRFGRHYPQRVLEVDIAGDAPLFGDPVLLRRMVDNILDNAVRYSSDAVSLFARTRGSRLRIEIRDNGIGIAEKDLEQVFRPFFRTDRSRARSTGGIGLGLGLARRIAAAHQGTLVLDSEQGVGTVVTIELPLATP